MLGAKAPDKTARMKALEDEANAKIKVERAKIREAIEKKRKLEKDEVDCFWKDLRQALFGGYVS
jgi:hypothetical protein